MQGLAEPGLVAEVDHRCVTAGCVDEVEVREGEGIGRVTMALDEVLQGVEGLLRQLVEAADELGTEFGQFRLAARQQLRDRDPSNVPLQQLDFLLAAGDQLRVALPEAADVE